MLREATPAEVARLGRGPVAGLVELTSRCNLACVHCYLNQAAAARAEEVPTGRLLRLFPEIAQAGGLFVTLSGGEPLLREDFPDVYLAAVGAGLVTSLYTNATLLSDRLADLLDEHRPEHVEVSVYGATRTTYEAVTRVPGSFDRCLEGIRRLVDRGVALRLKTMLLQANAHELGALRELASSLGAPFRFDGHVNARVDGRASRCREQRLAAEALVDLERGDPAEVEAMRDLLTRQAGEALSNTDLWACGAGRNGYVVDAGGRLRLCELARRQGVDLGEIAFGEGWSRLQALREGGLDPRSPCFRCPLRPLCGSCAGANEAETGDPHRPVPAFCEITHRRVAAMGALPPGHRPDASCCAGPASSPARGEGER